MKVDLVCIDMFVDGWSFTSKTLRKTSEGWCNTGRSLWSLSPTFPGTRSNVIIVCIFDNIAENNICIHAEQF